MPPACSKTGQAGLVKEGDRTLKNIQWMFLVKGPDGVMAVSVWTGSLKKNLLNLNKVLQYL
jgi:hypothetical protein